MSQLEKTVKDANGKERILIQVMIAERGYHRDPQFYIPKGSTLAQAMDILREQEDIEGRVEFATRGAKRLTNEDVLQPDDRITMSGKG